MEVQERTLYVTQGQLEQVEEKQYLFHSWTILEKHLEL